FYQAVRQEYQGFGIPMGAVFQKLKIMRMDLGFGCMSQLYDLLNRLCAAGFIFKRQSFYKSADTIQFYGICTLIKAVTRRSVVGIYIPAVVETRVGSIEFLMPDGRVGVAVALYAIHGGTQEDSPGGIHPVCHCLNPVYYLVRAADVITHGI